jgi:hypothetical protein
MANGAKTGGFLGYIEAKIVLYGTNIYRYIHSIITHLQVFECNNVLTTEKEGYNIVLGGTFLNLLPNNFLGEEYGHQ